MKRGNWGAIHLLIAVLFCVRATASSSAGEGSITNGLIAFFPFNGNAQDESGNGHHGTILGDRVTLTEGVNGQPNAAYRFAGDTVTNRITGAGVDLANSSMSISLWFRKNYVPTGQEHGWIISVHGLQPETGGQTGKVLHLSVDNPAALRFAFFFDELDIAAPKVGEDGWSHIVCTYDYVTKRQAVYVDAQLVASRTSTIGFSGGSNFYFHAGYDVRPASLDQIRFYNRVLTGEEVERIHDFELMEDGVQLPVIENPPTDVEVPLNGSATFQVTASGTGSLRYQWRFEGARIIGATTASLLIEHVSNLDEGDYTVEVTDDVGSVVSEPAHLFIREDTDGDGLSDRYETGFGRYELVPGPMTWRQARAAAEARGGHLATIVSAQEWAAIQEVIADRGESFANKSTAIGGTDEAVEGTWEWITGEPWTYTHWHQNGIEPNNGGGIEDALGITSYAGFPWNDIGPDSEVDHYLFERGYHTNPNEPDTDGDGLSDGDETLVHHTLPTSSDTDGDGYTDASEVMAGSDPTSAADFPGTVLRVFAAIELEFLTQAGKTYVVESSPDMESWSQVGSPIAGNGTVWKTLLSAREQESLFYRVVPGP